MGFERRRKRKFKIIEKCYEIVSRKETISYTFLNLMNNIQEYNAREI